VKYSRQKLFPWSAYYFGDQHMNLKPARFHFELCRLLETESRLAIAAPRYFAKSHFASFALSLFAALELGYEDIMLVSATSNKAQDLLEKIRIELATNEDLRVDYGVKIPKRKKSMGKWSNFEIRFFTANGPRRIRAKGRHFQVRGFHPDFLIVDDLEQDKELLKPEQREKLTSWFDRSLMRMMRPDDPVILVGTIIHPQSLLAKLIRRQGWTSRVYKALDAKDESIWPEAFSTQALRMERELDFYGFMSERQNTPLVSNRTIVMPDWIKPFPDSMPKIEETYLAVDPALTDKKTKEGCASGIVVLGIGEDQKIYEVHSEKGFWSATDCLARVIEVFRFVKPRPAYAGIESFVFQKVLAQIAQQVAPDINFLELGSQGRAVGKIERARPTIHLFQRSMVFLKNPELIEQVRAYPDGENDMADACFWALRMIMDFSTVWYDIKKREDEDDQENQVLKAVVDRIKARHAAAEGHGHDTFLGSEW
jgi:hypothetical protein